MPVKEIIEAGQTLADGQFTIEDVTATAGAGLEVLAAALDPVAGLVGAALGPLMDWLISNVSFFKEPMDALLGDPPGIRSNADRWTAAATSLTSIGGEIASSKGDLPSWTGPGAEAYKPVLDDLQSLLESTAASAKNFAQLSYMAGVFIGAVREVIWGLIKDTVNSLVAQGIIAAAAAIPSFGASLAAFTAWAAAKTSAACAWVAAKLSRLLSALANLGSAGSKIAQSLAKAADHLDTLAYAFGESSKMITRAGDNVHEVLASLDTFSGSGAAAVKSGNDAAKGATSDSRE